VINAVYVAVCEGDVETVARMLDEDPRLLSSEHTLLTRAASMGHAGMVRLLLERGADANTVDAHGTPALHIAAGRRHEEVVSLLLTNGAEANRVDRWGWTALLRASYSGLMAVVRLLLRDMGGRGLDARQNSGLTALWLACLQGHADVVRALLLAGADHTIASTHGETPRQIAQMKNHHQCVSIIEVRGHQSLMHLLILSRTAQCSIGPCYQVHMLYWFPTHPPCVCVAVVGG
jgi:ankyrin repeat protein